MDELYKRLSDIPLKSRGLVAFMIMIAASIAWYFLGVRPIDAQIVINQEQEKRIRAKLRNKSKTDEKIKNLQANIANQKNERARLGEKFPSQADIAILITKLHERARDSELEIKTFERGPTIALELYERIEITMSVKGTFAQILNFINELSDVRGLDRIVNVEDLSIRRESEVEQTQLTASFLLVTFMSKSAPPTPGGQGQVQGP